MFHDTDFPSFVRESSKLSFQVVKEFIDPQGRYRHIPKIPALTDVDDHERQKKTPITKTILNWQSETLLTHNKLSK